MTNLDQIALEAAGRIEALDNGWMGSQRKAKIQLIILDVLRAAARSPLPEVVKALEETDQELNVVWNADHDPEAEVNGLVRARQAVRRALSLSAQKGEPSGTRGLTAKEAIDAGMKIADKHDLVVQDMAKHFYPEVPLDQLSKLLRGNKVWLAAQIMKAMQASEAALLQPAQSGEGHE